MSIGQGIPAIVCTFEEQTSKCQMWDDIGLSEWLFDLDQKADHSRIAEAVVHLAKHPAEAATKAARARNRVAALHKNIRRRLGMEL